ncbi:MAG: hypothetical protein EXS31_07245 [Pedosphaera sp.]|nr:hypothetical protein [Pedosphaera sp.]
MIQTTRFVISVLLGLTVFRLGAADLSLKTTAKEPPKELAESIRARLQPSAIQLFSGEKPVYEIWLASELPVLSKPASVVKALESVKQATLLGAVVVGDSLRDYRDDEISPGVYTMRFAFQPQDGNHLGTSEFTYYAVLVASKNDTAPDAIPDYKKLVKASSKGRSNDHPIILSLRPSSVEADDVPKLNEPASDHKSVQVRIPGIVAGIGEKVNITFELVYQGTGKK